MFTMTTRKVVMPRAVRHPFDDERFYPSSDGKPMAETDAHVNLIVYAKSTLVNYFLPQSESVYVGANNFLYYEQGNPRKRVSPDAYVVLGRPQSPPRRSYFLWLEENKAPNVVFEFTSQKTRGQDFSKKFDLYQSLRVPEYFLFDPTGDYLNPRLQGYRLKGRRYVRLDMVEGQLHSEQLELSLIVSGDMMRFFDERTGRLLPTLMEAEERYKVATERAALDRKRADETEAEIETLRAQIARLRSEAGTTELQEGIN